MVHFVLGLLVTQALVACSGDGVTKVSSGPLPPYTPLVTIPDGHGRFMGTVTIAGVSYFGDALLTADGEFRLYVGDPAVGGGGALQFARPRSSAQLVGTAAAGRATAGSGVVVGQACQTADSSRFCSVPGAAEMTLAVSPTNMLGEIRVMTKEAEENWRLDLQQWRYTYEIPATLRQVTGVFYELQAEFARDRDTAVRIDETGRLFFQSANSGCTGNGSLAPHLDGKFNVYDVSLSIATCDAVHGHMNGDFKGFASVSTSTAWSEDVVIRIWLSTRDGMPPRVAITMLLGY